MDIKREGSIFSCSICPFTTETSLEHLSHLTNHIYEKLEYVCPHCEFVSSYRDIVVDHMKIHEQESDFLIDEEVFKDDEEDTVAVTVIKEECENFNPKSKREVLDLFVDNRPRGLITQEIKHAKKRGRPPNLKEIYTEALENITTGIKPVGLHKIGRLAKLKEVKIETQDLQEITKEIKPVKKLTTQPKSKKKDAKSSADIIKENKLVTEKDEPQKTKDFKPEIQEEMAIKMKPVKKRGRPPKPKDLIPEIKEEIAMEIKPAKKRGRPPNPTILIPEVQEEMAMEIKPVKKRGRPPKPKYLKPEIQQEMAMEIKSVKKRGRPPKPKYLKPEIQEEMAMENKPFKKRGRPPKPKYLKPEIQEEMAMEIKPVKKRGRPPKPKYLKPEIQEEMAMAIKPVKKRGRPPKPKYLITETQEKIKTEKNINVFHEIELQPLEEFSLVSNIGRYSRGIKTFEKQNGSPKFIEPQVSKSQLSFSEQFRTGNEETTNNITSVPVKPKRVRNNGPFICPVCKKHFAFKQTLKNHFKLHAVNKLECSKCHFFCERKKLMRLHMKMHVGKKFSCEHCPEFFTSRKMKREHLKMNHADIAFPFFCRECGYSCDNIVSIKKHIQCYHPREDKKEQLATAKHFCPHCSYTTSVKAKHTLHLRTHTGERPYQCMICSYRATQSSALKQHMIRLHPEQKGFTQSLASFSSSSHLVKDLKTDIDTNELTCDICGKSFISEHNLCRHKRLHSLGHTCAQCNQFFLYSKAFISHLKRHDAANGKIETAGDGKSLAKGIWSPKMSVFETEASHQRMFCEAAASGQTNKFMPWSLKEFESLTAKNVHSNAAGFEEKNASCSSWCCQL